jgi:uncharacterized membrane protein
MDYKESVVTIVAKASPPVTVGAITLAGIPLSNVTLVLTAVYLVLQIVFLVLGKWKESRVRKD